MEKQNLQITPLPSQKETGIKTDSSLTQITIGKTTFFVKVHFGKIPLENILRQRILNEHRQKV